MHRQRVTTKEVMKQYNPIPTHPPFFRLQYYNENELSERKGVHLYDTLTQRIYTQDGVKSNFGFYCPAPR
jgi:hypothetical protein